MSIRVVHYRMLSIIECTREQKLIRKREIGKQDTDFILKKELMGKLQELADGDTFTQFLSSTKH